ncbi:MULTISPECIES: PA4780 family RIO1-like protein kinase [unclassified Undibacterium]|uniref:PA4780 family RIO1-like protein kinase n=1 Tax=unclassified Undibacterium TaxID=2630295 RepID=UPI002AC957E0|nr:MULTISPECIES: PA4780 family RIO1-like protein kinase [unclassified Undibacterium]MEB0138424.1 PA4780 family RIO1-like protein kinase [Undibacterium sp. CCC2.1]MEB0171299.1 PA4780 family RIO1-like protein kinase [Undibacterium sp. CCC1.1]MEB0176463.1 PA4780 family RIO1-like protein kinase [Undibacterium sp. CCC3.4]MEB0214053.1 PA4780 family RIO1-like protein kinase [Undibacterium sp. 5I2]WPX43666.1 PA4780 family RIO1-like protein kinase [Undibacterium sp. CCC3.4]
MKTPKRLAPLVEEGLIDEVLRQLMSGKEATVYVVRCGEEIRCAKVYKEASQRSFKQAASYQEGRKVKNSRQARAMEKGSRYGRKMQEEVWQNAEVDALYKLAAAGVKVPTPYLCFEGVLLMDLVTDADGHAAPRLNDVELSPEMALQYHAQLLQQVVLMLCAGVIHGDLSEFNILVDGEGPVIIDLPQAIDAASNTEAAVMLERDVTNLANYFGQFAPQLTATQYGKEIWSLYIAGELNPDVVLSGQVAADTTPVDLDAVLEEIESAILDEQDRLRRMAEA